MCWLVDCQQHIFSYKIISSTHQNVQAGSFQERDLVRDGQRSEARHSFGKFHDLDNALSGQLAELVPQAQVQPHTVVCTRVLQHTHTQTETKASDEEAGTFVIAQTAANDLLSALASLCSICVTLTYSK